MLTVLFLVFSKAVLGLGSFLMGFVLGFGDGVWGFRFWILELVGPAQTKP